MRTQNGSDHESVEVEPGVHLRQLSVGERMSVQDVRIEPGAEVPEHSHPHEQLGFVYDGTLTFRVDDEEITVEAGGSYVIPGDEPHGAINEGDEPVRAIDVFSPPRPDPDWAD